MGATLVIDKRDVELSLVSPQVMQIRYADGQTEKAGLNAVRTVVLVGDIKVSAGLLRAWSESRVEVVLLAGRGRKEPIFLLPTLNGGMALRLAQYRVFHEPSLRFSLAKQMVSAKLMAQYRVLAEQQRFLPLERFLDSVQRAKDLNGLMGVEGAATARYFQVWQELITPPWQFGGRQRQPPGDAVNALLSLSYAMATTKVIHLLASRGLEANVGYLHGPLRNRPALALDLLEPLRSEIDSWVRELICEECVLLPSHFTHSKQDGTRLNQEGRQIYFGMWAHCGDNRLHSYSRHALALLIKNLRPYVDRKGFED